MEQPHPDPAAAGLHGSVSTVEDFPRLPDHQEYASTPPTGDSQVANNTIAATSATTGPAQASSTVVPAPAVRRGRARSAALVNQENPILNPITPAEEHLAILANSINRENRRRAFSEAQLKQQRARAASIAAPVIPQSPIKEENSDGEDNDPTPKGRSPAETAEHTPTRATSPVGTLFAERVHPTTPTRVSTYNTLDLYSTPEQAAHVDTNPAEATSVEAAALLRSPSVDNTAATRIEPATPIRAGTVVTTGDLVETPERAARVNIASAEVVEEPESAEEPAPIEKAASVEEEVSVEEAAPAKEAVEVTTPAHPTSIVGDTSASSVGHSTTESAGTDPNTFRHDLLARATERAARYPSQHGDRSSRSRSQQGESSSRGSSQDSGRFSRTPDQHGDRSARSPSTHGSPSARSHSKQGGGSSRSSSKNRQRNGSNSHHLTHPFVQLAQFSDFSYSAIKGIMNASGYPNYLDSPGAGSNPRQAPPSPSQGMAQNGMNGGMGLGGAGAMVGFPTPAGHQSDLNYIMAMVEELCGQLSLNQGLVGDVVEKMGKVRAKAKNMDLSNDELLAIAASELSESSENLEKENSELRKALEKARHDSSENWKLACHGANILRDIADKMHEFKANHEKETLQWHRNYRNQLEFERAENLFLRDQIQDKIAAAGRANEHLRQMRRYVTDHPELHELRVENDFLRKDRRSWKRMALPLIPDDDSEWTDDDDLIDPEEKKRKAAEEAEKESKDKEGQEGGDTT